MRNFGHSDNNLSRGFNGSVNISENYDFRSPYEYDPFYIIL